MAQIKALLIPLSERPFCIGKAELMGYLGIKSEVFIARKKYKMMD